MPIIWFITEHLLPSPVKIWILHSSTFFWTFTRRWRNRKFFLFRRFSNSLLIIIKPCKCWEHWISNTQIWRSKVHDVFIKSIDIFYDFPKNDYEVFWKLSSSLRADNWLRRASRHRRRSKLIGRSFQDFSVPACLWSDC